MNYLEGSNDLNCDNNGSGGRRTGNDSGLGDGNEWS